MSTVGIKITGQKELDKVLKLLPRRLSRKIVRGALRAAAKPMLKDAKAGIPKKTGLTRKDLKVRNIKNSNPIAVAIAGSTSKGGRDYIMRFLERGRKGQPAKPFLRPAFDRNKAESVKILALEIRKRLLLETKKIAGKK